ncbi:hypothetical protein Hypma_007494 [Hypsizygus marmoreus]|uniref:Uncharacterized protein n=1 Tax=Hypsizygus marmoreus TaxID=39966 RepID=A0A369JW42_HYPMA|nr:hypothetical protein Hypma_007494 [Hypsizygus marmoreus]
MVSITFATSSSAAYNMACTGSSPSASGVTLNSKEIDSASCELDMRVHVTVPSEMSRLVVLIANGVSLLPSSVTTLHLTSSYKEFDETTLKLGADNMQSYLLLRLGLNLSVSVRCLLLFEEPFMVLFNLPEEMSYV